MTDTPGHAADAAARMSAERLAEIREHAAFASTYAEYQRVAGTYVPELLAEVDRLNALVGRLDAEWSTTHQPSDSDICRHEAHTEADARRLIANASGSWQLERRLVSPWRPVPVAAMEAVRCAHVKREAVLRAGVHVRTVCRDCGDDVEAASQ